MSHNFTVIVKQLPEVCVNPNCYRKKKTGYNQNVWFPPEKDKVWRRLIVVGMIFVQFM